ncbi:hypothetical protein BDZ89DRAFT_1074819 [Hymenopellis radicata]|nr:hypothetical protein BDZ89DRAFT_1074819 [Hymenopellis radicata]
MWTGRYGIDQSENEQQQAGRREARESLCMDSMFDYHYAGVRAEDDAPLAPLPRGLHRPLFFSHTVPAYTPHHEYLVVLDPSYLIVSGYPPDKYASTLDFFLSLSSEYSMSTNAPSSAGTTQPESLYDVGNAFKLGYTKPADAVRALRKNGDVIRGGGGAGGWADASANISSPPQSVHDEADNMDVDVPGSVGTPIKLAPNS